jgi:predicted Zn-dependent protease
MERIALVAVALTACAHGSTLTRECERGPSDRCIGRIVDAVLMTTSWNEVDDRELARYVTRVGERVAHAAGRDERWTFRVIDAADVNAEANLDNTVYVTRGALARLRSEAELAGLLGHEIGHVLAGHGHEEFAERMGEVARSDGDRALRSARDDEIQADELAVLLASHAGYDPRAVETMLRAIASRNSFPASSAAEGGAGVIAQGNADLAHAAEDRHPGWVERLARVRAFADQLPGGELGEARYAAAIARLALGEDPQQVAVVGDAIVLGRAGLALDLPHGTPTLVDQGAVGLAIAHTGVRVQPVTPEAAHYVDTHRVGDRIAWIANGMHGPVVIVVQGPQLDEVAALLRRATRTPRRAELTLLHPQHVDFAAPRKLWPQD